MYLAIHCKAKMYGLKFLYVQLINNVSILKYRHRHMSIYIDLDIDSWLGLQPFLTAYFNSCQRQHKTFTCNWDTTMINKISIIIKLTIYITQLLQQ